MPTPLCCLNSMVASDQMNAENQSSMACALIQSFMKPVNQCQKLKMELSKDDQCDLQEEFNLLVTHLELIENWLTIDEALVRSLSLNRNHSGSAMPETLLLGIFFSFMQPKKMWDCSQRKKPKKSDFFGCFKFD